MAYETTTYRRIELYDQVWAEPVRTVAKRYGVSDVALAKVCRKLHVPLPGRGYWAAKEAGKAPERPLLPALTEGVPDQIRVFRQRPDAGPLVDAEVVARVAVAKSGAAIVVPALLSSPHPLVARSAKVFGRAKRVTDGGSDKCLAIFVAPASLDRALRIVDTLLKALEELGYEVEVAEVHLTADERRNGYDEPRAPRYVTRVRVSGEWIEWSLHERWRTEPPPAPRPAKSNPRVLRLTWPRAEQPAPVSVPTGVLALEISGNTQLGTRRTWNDGKVQRLEGCLNDFIGELIATADALKRDRTEADRLRREREEEDRRRWEAQRRAAEDASATKELNEVLGRWRLARDLREYVSEIRSMVAAADRTLSPESKLGVSLEWLSNFATRVDPVARMRDKLESLLVEAPVDP